MYVEWPSSAAVKEKRCTLYNIAMENCMHSLLLHLQHVVDISSGSDCVMGSIICPSCASICYDQLDNCPTTGIDTTLTVHSILSCA